MNKKGQAVVGGIGFIGFLGLITIIVVVLNIPQIQIQTKDVSNLEVSNNKINIRDIVVWNKGGTVGGNLFFTPNICIYASVSNNISCTHKGYGSDIPCDRGICGTVSPGELSQKDILHLQLKEENIDNFILNITAKGYVSFLTLTTDSKSLNCSLNKTNNRYDCTEK